MLLAVRVSAGGRGFAARGFADSAQPASPKREARRRSVIHA